MNESIKRKLAESESEVAGARARYMTVVKGKAKRVADGDPHADILDAAINREKLAMELSEKKYESLATEMRMSDMNRRSTLFNLAMLLVSVASAYFAWQANHRDTPSPAMPSVTATSPASAPAGSVPNGGAP